MCECVPQPDLSIKLYDSTFLNAFPPRRSSAPPRTNNSWPTLVAAVPHLNGSSCWKKITIFPDKFQADDSHRSHFLWFEVIKNAKIHLLLFSLEVVTQVINTPGAETTHFNFQINNRKLSDNTLRAAWYQACIHSDDKPPKMHISNLPGWFPFCRGRISESTCLSLLQCLQLLTLGKKRLVQSEDSIRYADTKRR